MSNSTVSSNDALQVYAVALAFLYDTELDLDTVSTYMSVEKVSRSLYFIAKRADCKPASTWKSRPATCEYTASNKTWNIKFTDRKSITFIDTDRQWELVHEDTKQNTEKERKSRKTKQKR